MGRSKRVTAPVEAPAVACCERCRTAFGASRTGALGAYVVRRCRVAPGFCVQCSMFVFPVVGATERYELIGYRVHPRTGERADAVPVVLCPGPFTHAECMTAKSKFTPRADFAITVRALQEAV